MAIDTPIWIPLGLAASVLNATIPLIQEKFKANGFSIAVWVKIALVLFSIPIVLYTGMPTAPEFYLMAALSGLIWCVNDVIFYRTVPVVGAGVVSRIIPGSVILAFILWFLVEPELFTKYMERPWQFAALSAIVLLSVFFTIAMKSCPVTWQGIKMLWLVVLAAATGPLINKLALGQAPAVKAPFALMFTQAAFMVAFWSIYSLIKKPVSREVFLSKEAIKGGILIGFVSTILLGLKFTALNDCEHPALLSVLLFTDTIWIILYYRLSKREDHSKIWAGLGLVACAAALILVKSL